jgi:hypothetical protein
VWDERKNVAPEAHAGDTLSLARGFGGICKNANFPRRHAATAATPNASL